MQEPDRAPASSPASEPLARRSARQLGGLARRGPCERVLRSVPRSDRPVVIEDRVRHRRLVVLRSPPPTSGQIDVGLAPCRTSARTRSQAASPPGPRARRANRRPAGGQLVEDGRGRGRRRPSSPRCAGSASRSSRAHRGRAPTGAPRTPALLPERRPLLDPESVLLVDHDHPERAEPHVVGEQRVGADDQVEAAGEQLGEQRDRSPAVVRFVSSATAAAAPPSRVESGDLTARRASSEPPGSAARPAPRSGP